VVEDLRVLDHAGFFFEDGKMELGMIGLGRMGTNMVRRLRRAGQQCEEGT